MQESPIFRWTHVSLWGVFGWFEHEVCKVILSMWPTNKGWTEGQEKPDRLVIFFLKFMGLLTDYKVVIISTTWFFQVTGFRGGQPPFFRPGMKWLTNGGGVFNLKIKRSSLISLVIGSGSDWSQNHRDFHTPGWHPLRILRVAVGIVVIWFSGSLIHTKLCFSWNPRDPDHPSSRPATRLDGTRVYTSHTIHVWYIYLQNTRVAHTGFRV